MNHVKTYDVLTVCLTLIVLFGMSLVSKPVPAQEEQGAVDNLTLEEVVVTARKIEESLQEIPVAVTTFSGQELERRQIESADYLNQVVPNLNFDGAAPVSGVNSAASIYIRGIGQNDFVPTIDPGVGLYVDDVYLARSAGSVIDFVDIERIEVLRGPQGTLFGRNTIGGAVVIHTRKPGDTFEASAKVEIGSDDKNFWTGMVNIPLSDSLRTRAIVSRRVRDGYVDRVVDGIDLGDDDTWGGRVSMLWTPSDTFEAYFVADYTDENENGTPAISLGINELQTFPAFVNQANPNCPGIRALGPPHLVNRFTHGNPNCANETAFIGQDKAGGSFPTTSQLEVWGTSLTLRWDVAEWLTVKSITAYRDLDSLGIRDADNTAIPLNFIHTTNAVTQDQVSQELQFSGRAFDERLNWLLGLYYFQEDATKTGPIELAVGAGQYDSADDNDSKAIFAQGTFDATEQLSITAGVRYTEDSKRFTPDIVWMRGSVILPPFVVVGPPPAGLISVGTRVLPQQEFKREFDDVNFLANISYRMTDKVMTYFSYSEGFKSGGFDERPLTPEPAPMSFEPETAQTFEIGLKSDLFNDRVRFNVAAFHTQYDDMHVVVRPIFSPFIVNAGEAEINGFELETTIIPTGNLQINGSVGYLDAEYKELDPLVSATTAISEDSELAKTPEWTTNLGAALTWPLLDLGTLSARADWSYRSETYNDATNGPLLRQESYHLVNLSLAFDSADEHWQIVVAGTNLTDDRFVRTGTDNFFSGSGYAEAVYNRPAEWSLSLKYNFF